MRVFLTSVEPDRLGLAALTNRPVCGGVATPAVTLDREVLGAAERLRQKTGESRSALVNRALRLLVSDDARRAQVAQYVQGYREHPETDDDVAVARELAAATLKALPWK